MTAQPPTRKRARTAPRRRAAARRKAPPTAARVAALRRRLRDAGVEALLVTHARDIRYLTGFMGDDSWAVVPAGGGKVTILSDFRFEEQIAREAPDARAVMRRGPLSAVLETILQRRGWSRLGLQPAHVTLAQRKVLAKRLGAFRLVEVDDGLLEQRSVKGPEEVKAIRRALAIQQQAMRETLAFIEPGLAEYEVAAYLEYRMRALGADGPSFPTIVAADASASLPHAVPGRRKLKRGGIVLIDWGARWGGYCSDLTRVYGLGGMKPKMREIYRVVLEAQQAGIDAVRPGATLAEVDGAARAVIASAGYGKRFGHSLGHGIGLDIHEHPALSGQARGVLEPGQVVTVEPGVYLPGVGGVRIEDDVQVTERGRRVLSDLPKSLESAMI